MVSVCWAAFSCYGSVTHFGLYYYQRSSTVRGRREDEMEQKDLKRLSRADLLEMLVDQSAELQRMQMKYEAAQRALEQRTILMDNAGSIAEAALQLNGVLKRPRHLPSSISTAWRLWPSARKMKLSRNGSIT